jgi:peptidoglycan/xylan/chitin deacetylase (PgdA/CDA1 family)
VKIVLKVDVDTYEGTRLGVPALVELCRRQGVPATFLFSLGPDHTGRAIKRVFRPGFLSKVSRTSVLEHYGLKTLLYGTLLPGPDIGRRCAQILRDVASAGMEVGVHCFDHARWQDDLARGGPQLARREMQRAVDRFREVFGVAPSVHGAAGWQMTDEALLAEAALGFSVASDTRGGGPFLPVVAGQVLDVVQLPTTLPTLDELVGGDDEAGQDPIGWILRQTAAAPGDHVYTLHAELEGRRFLDGFERLIAGWKAQGYEFTTLGGLAAGLDRDRLPRRTVGQGSVPGRSGLLAVAND